LILISPLIEGIFVYKLATVLPHRRFDKLSNCLITDCHTGIRKGQLPGNAKMSLRDPIYRGEAISTIEVFY
ncbi:MAG TPA: hypothetical protein DCR59_03280, partial [Dehalococcoidia bacterium]|nr:hypothetical protein [Dehalococcoidia bacterium]